MTNDEKLLLRIKQTAGLHEITVYVTPEKKIAFWVIEKTGKPEGEKGDKIPIVQVQPNA